ncbi:MAG: FprA family A-type flavoprotein [Chloroflexota bacterium]
MKTVELIPGITWVGIEDWNRRFFDALIPLPHGTSYNSYLAIGKNRVALIDTAGRGFEDQLLAKIQTIVPPEKIDYIVMNHAEPDHAGAIPAVMSAALKAQVVTTKKGGEMAGVLHRVPESRCLTIRDGDTLDLGGKTLRFLEAPWLHWPETMFTFAVEDKVLFPCDFFGAHMATDRLFDDEVSDDLIPEAKRYYSEIMMPFTRMVTAGLDKAKNAAPRIIAPSHGPVYRRPERILESYEKWSRGRLAAKAVVAYISMWQSTEQLAKAIASSISVEGIETVPFDLSVSDISHVTSELVDASAIVLGSPTVLGGLHPVAANALSLLKVLRPRLKLAAFFGSYGWGGGAATQAKALLEPTGCELIGTLDIRGTPGEKEIADAVSLGQKVAQRIKESLK